MRRAVGTRGGWEDGGPTVGTVGWDETSRCDCGRPGWRRAHVYPLYLCVSAALRDPIFILRRGFLRKGAKQGSQSHMTDSVGPATHPTVSHVEPIRLSFRGLLLT